MKQYKKRIFGILLSFALMLTADDDAGTGTEPDGVCHADFCEGANI